MTYISKPPVPYSPRDDRWKNFLTTIMRKGPVYSVTTGTPNVVGAETTLANGTIKPNIVKRDGDQLVFSGGGELITTVNTKRIRVYLQTSSTLYLPLLDDSRGAADTFWFFKATATVKNVTATTYDLALYVEYASSAARNLLISRGVYGINSSQEPINFYVTGLSTGANPAGNDMRLDYWNCDYTTGLGLQQS